MKIEKCVVLVCLLLGWMASPGVAQPGKITAKVIDAATGEPIMRAGVRVIETKQGGYTKADGVVNIINITPGVYTVEASFPNYHKKVMTDVKVKSGITTSIDFSLSTRLDSEVMVFPDPIVDKPVANDDKFDKPFIDRLPGQSPNDVVYISPGVIKDGTNGGASINGSRGTSTAYEFGGTNITDVVTGMTGSLQQNLSRYALEEVDVIKGGADASKGNFGGGVVNATTASGGSKLSFDLHYRGELGGLFGSNGNGFKQMAEGNHLYEFAVGGPLIGNDLNFFVTGKTITKEHNNISGDDIGELGEGNLGLGVVDPAGNNLGQMPHTSLYGRSLSAKLTFNILGFRSSADVIVSSTSYQFNTWNTLYADQAQLPATNNVNNMYSLNMTGEIGGAILELQGGYVTLDNRFGKYSGGGGMLELYKLFDPKDDFTYNDISRSASPGGDNIIDIYTPVSRQIANPNDPGSSLILVGAGVNPFTGHIEGGPITFTSANPYGLMNRFVSAGNVAGFSNDSRTRLQLEAKYSQQIGEHYLRGGVEAQLHTISSYSNTLPWDANPFEDQYKVNPMTFAAYFIDKMEFSDIIFQPSLRFDVYDPKNERVIIDPFNPTPAGKAWYKDAPVQTQLSPRLGINYRVAENTSFNFNYGWYFKHPLMGEVLTNTGGYLPTILSRGNQILGNGGLKAERTKEIVLGFSTALSDVLKMSVQGVSKDMRNLSGLQYITSEFLPVGYTMYADDQYGNSKSIQLSLDKRLRDNWGVRFNYTLSSTKGTASSATENYARLINTAAGSEVAVLPLQPFNLNFDRPHVAQLILMANYAKNEGPSILGLNLLESMSISATSEFRSGVPYTKLDLKGNQAGEFNGDRHPSYFQTDATLTRTIQLADLFGETFGTSSFDIQLEVLNLFNRTAPMRVYAMTGQGDDDGSSGVYPGATVFKNDPTNGDGQQLDAVGNLRYNARADYNNDGVVDLSEQQTSFTRLRKDTFDRRANYQVPRRVYLNLAFKF